MAVARRGADLEDALADVEKGHVERSAAEVEDEDRLVRLLVEAVSQRRCGRLVDDAQDLQARDFARVLGRRALASLKYAGTVMTAWSTGSPR